MAPLDLPRPRTACSDAERRASRALARELRRRERRTRIDTVWVRPQWAWTWMVLALVGVGGSVAAPGAPEAALIVLGIAAAAAVGELSGLVPLASWPWPRRATQNVVGLAPGGDPSRTRLIVGVAYDTPRRASGLLARLGAGSPALVCLALVALAACAGARVGGASGTLIGAVQLFPTLVCLLTVAGLLEQALARPSASADAVEDALALVAALDARPPLRLDVELLLVGAGDARAAAFPLRRDGDVALLWLEPGGDGVAWHRAGALRFHPDLVAAAEAAGYARASGPAPLPAARARRARWPAVAVSGGDAVALVRALDASLARQRGMP